MRALDRYLEAVGSWLPKGQLPSYWRVLKVATSRILTVFVVLYLVFAGIVNDKAPALAHPGLWIWQFGLILVAGD